MGVCLNWTRLDARPPAGPHSEETPMSKRSRKRRARKKNAANHGKKPNS